MPNYPVSAVFTNGVFCRLYPIKPSGKKTDSRLQRMHLKGNIEADDRFYSST